ncbi:MAG TPA: ATP-binding protein [Solirubrobacteraceae bacterium]|nr:ATP-binding protein [Solirubrobacteraceae bacterium]
MSLRRTDGRAWLAVAGLLFAAVFAWRIADKDPRALITLLYVAPIAMVAVQRGVRWGLGAGALALGLFAVWDAGWSHQGHGAWSYVARGAAFFVLGGVAGALADRVRMVSAHSTRFWELSRDLLGTAGFDGYFKRVNPAWQRTLGWSASEITSRPFVDFVHPDDREKTAAEAASLTSANYETRTFQNRQRCKDGSYRTILWSATSIPEQGLIYAAGRDVTKAMRAHLELRASERFLDSVLENLPNMVFVKDAGDLTYVRVNRAGELLLGATREELIGTRGDALLSTQAADVLAQKDREVLAGDAVVDILDEAVATPNGTRIVHTRKVAIRDEHGEPRYLLGISDDITDQRRAEHAEQAARAEAERANQAKNAFLSRMSHELRTPLNAVIGFGQLLQLDEMTPGQSEAVEQILKAGRHLLDLINEVLDISLIESGAMSLSLEPVRVAEVLAESLSLIGPMADEMQVHLTASPATRADLHVLADQQRLKQVLINLLSNAVKYNRHGGEVSVECTELSDKRIEIVVADNGRGMSSDQLERLFAPFDRLGAEGSGVEGTGLGLSLSRGLVEAMGATITAESQPEVGTTMRVKLASSNAAPMDATARTASAQTTERCARSTIVYIEDNLSNLRLVERLVARFPGVRLIPAMQGSLAIDLARQHRPDLILLDLHLPDMNGREVLDRLKRDPATAAIPVIVLSADASPARVAWLGAAGAAGYVSKPINAESLLEVVWRHARKASSAELFANGP